MSLRLAAPARQPFHPAWIAVPLLPLVIAFAALMFAGSPHEVPLQADGPAEWAALPVAA